MNIRSVRSPFRAGRRCWLLLALLAGPVPGQAEDAVPLSDGLAAMESPSRDEDVLNDLAFFALSLSGTPYRYGGESPDLGFDCSGFVRYVFRRSLGVELPRNTQAINRLGQPVEPAQLRPGDLVFYDTLRSMFSHVGIYLGDDRFVHSPSKGGKVRVEHMQDSYWQRRYNGARRIIASSRGALP